MSDTAATLPMIQSSCFINVAPGRLGALTLLVMDGREQNATSDSVHIKTASKRLKAAMQELSKTFPDALARVEFQEPENLQTNRKAAIDALAPLVDALERKACKAIQDLGGAEVMRDRYLNVIEPALNAFLDTMTETLAQEHRMRQSKTKRRAIAAVQSAETVGRSIQMIAVNASIEAARAGQSGRGFKVIADEVRNLAGETQKLLSEISETMGRL